MSETRRQGDLGWQVIGCDTAMAAARLGSPSTTAANLLSDGSPGSRSNTQSSFQWSANFIGKLAIKKASQNGLPLLRGFCDRSGETGCFEAEVNC
ncbi:hypothetical protein [Rhizobium tumorigenes]|uniref:Uncharacterized protein n=1 Tax=Rhizobium tumorigenes TaxID=2041385 RepID=A0AAF1K5G0_9HYPH|nr:hypothetical protein [Rhizobium tumorigenes]WFR96065.1 hypothetical protein PR017_02625 [Rhizobium tumorigenes]